MGQLRVCLICGKDFPVKPSRIKRGGGKYCSKPCKDEGLKKKIDDIVKIMKLYQRGHGLTHIAKIFGTHCRKIKEVLRVNKIKIRDRSEQKKIEYKNNITRVRHAPLRNCLGCGNPFKYQKGKREKYCSNKCQGQSKEFRDKVRRKTLMQISSGKMPQAYTKIEAIVKQLLNQLHIQFVQQKQFGFWVYDFYLPEYQLFVECDGDYWHGNPAFFSKLNVTQKKNRVNDKRKATYLERQGYKLLRFWEYDIKNNLGVIRNEILSQI